jgi:hypothetical protein
MKTPTILFLSLALCGFALQISAAPTQGPQSGLDAVRRWNQIANDASGLDHATAREQLGPGRASRALAIVQIAVFDAVNAVVGEYEGFTGVRAPSGPMSLEATISQAAHDTLAALFPAQAASFDARLAEDLAQVKNKNAKASGIDLGRRAANACLRLRVNDGSEIPESFIGVDWVTSDQPGRWRMDPISRIPITLGGHWGKCKPFVLESSTPFRVPPFPNMASAA